MVCCNKNMHNNDNQSEKMTKGTQTPRRLRPKSVLSQRAARMCAEKDNDCTLSTEEGDPYLMMGQSSTLKLKRCRLFYNEHNQQLLSSRRIRED